MNFACSLFLAVASVGCSNTRHPQEVLVPNKYIGWIRVEYGVKNSPPLPVVQGAVILKFPRTGLLRTSSMPESGLARDRFYYYSGKTLYPLRQTVKGRGGVVWGGLTTRETRSWKKGQRIYQRFFIGPERLMKPSD